MSQEPEQVHTPEGEEESKERETVEIETSGEKKRKLKKEEVNVLAVLRTGYFDTMMTFCRYVAEGKSPFEHESKLLREVSTESVEEARLLELIVPLMRADSIRSFLKESAKHKLPEGKNSTKEKLNPFAKFSEVKLSPETSHKEAEELVKARVLEIPQESLGKINKFIADRVHEIENNPRVRSEVHSEMISVIHRGGCCGPEGMVGETGICCGDGTMYSFVTGNVITYTETIRWSEVFYEDYKYWESNEPNKYCIPICRECGNYKDFAKL